MGRDNTELGIKFSDFQQFVYFWIIIIKKLKRTRNTILSNFSNEFYLKKNIFLFQDLKKKSTQR